MAGEITKFFLRHMRVKLFGYLSDVVSERLAREIDRLASIVSVNAEGHIIWLAQEFGSFNKIDDCIYDA